MRFPFGKAPLFLLILAVATSVTVLITHRRFKTQRADLVLLTHAPLHADIYKEMLPEFERQHGVTVDIQVMDQRALRGRLQAAFRAGTAVPDLVELNESISYYSRGPVEDIGFLDLTTWIKERHLMDRMVPARFASYSTRGHIFAIPHDVHPVMLAYRADIVEGELGLRPETWTTWDQFATEATKLTRDLNGDGIPDRYALEMTADGRNILPMMLRQRGGGFFDEAGNVTLDNDIAVQTVVWYLRAAHGPHTFGFDPGSGQPFYRALNEGLVLFYFTPDWRTRHFSAYAPGLAGKMKLIPMPAWEPGGRRTSTWSATGLAVTKSSQQQSLALQLAEFLYLPPNDDGVRATQLQILPPVRETWASPVFDQPNVFFSGQPYMRMFADLASEVPAVWVTPYSLQAEGKLTEGTINASFYYREHGEDGLTEFVARELRARADEVRELVARNRFLKD